MSFNANPRSFMTIQQPTARREPALRRGRPLALDVVALGGGALAGLLAGVDAILSIFLLVMLNGSEGGDLAVPGLGHAGWSASQGVVFGLGPIGVAILLVAAGAGVAVVAARRGRRGAPTGPMSRTRRRPSRAA
jgi:hypothetical protein